jgi:hypothetical protein
VIRRLLGLAVFLLFMHAAVRGGIVWLHYQNFKDGVRETALFAGTKTDEDLRGQVMRLAEQNSVPLNPDSLTVDRAGGVVTIKASYVEMVEWIPTYKRPWEFTVVSR